VAWAWTIDPSRLAEAAYRLRRVVTRLGARPRAVLACPVSVNGHDCSRGTARLGVLSSAAASLHRIIAGSLTPLPENVQEACRLFTYAGWSPCRGRLGCCTCVQSGGKVVE
jgi:hypothetical protein